jgi:hypothetical protein
MAWLVTPGLRRLSARRSVRRGLDALEHEPACAVGVEPEPVADLQTRLGERSMGQRHLAPLTDDRLTRTSELALSPCRLRCGAR